MKSQFKEISTDYVDDNEVNSFCDKVKELWNVDINKSEIIFA